MDRELKYYLANIESSFIALRVDIDDFKKYVELSIKHNKPYEHESFFTEDIKHDTRLMITYIRALKDKLGEVSDTYK